MGSKQIGLYVLDLFRYFKSRHFSEMLPFLQRRRSAKDGSPLPFFQLGLHLLQCFDSASLHRARGRRAVPSANSDQLWPLLRASPPSRDETPPPDLAGHRSPSPPRPDLHTHTVCPNFPRSGQSGERKRRNCSDITRRLGRRGGRGGGGSQDCTRWWAERRRLCSSSHPSKKSRVKKC